MTTLINLQKCDVKSDFGATGNGSTVDTTAIQNAINSLGSIGGIVYFPQGTYLTDTLYVPSNVTLLGYDKYSTILQLVNSPTGSLVDCSGSISSVKSRMRFQNLTFQHNQYFTKNGELKGVLLRGYYTKDVQVVNCVFRECSVYGILISQIDSNNTYADSWIIDKCDFYNFANSTWGVFCYDQGEYVKILNSKFHQLNGGAVQTSDSANALISGNTFLQCGNSVYAYPTINIICSSSSINGGKATICDNKINHNKYMAVKLIYNGKNTQYGCHLINNDILINEGHSNNPVGLHGANGCVVTGNKISAGSLYKSGCIYLADNVSPADYNVIANNIFMFAGINSTACSGTHNNISNNIVDTTQG